MKFPIVIEDKKKIRLKLFIVFSIIFIIIEGAFFYPEDENNLKILLFFGIPSLLWMAALLYSNFAIKNTKIIGEIELKNNELIINKTKISFSNIKVIKNIYDNYYGVWIRLNVTQGDNNEIFILTNDNKQIRIKIFLKDKLSFGNLKRFASILIKNEVNVIFYEGRKKIYP